MLDSGLEDQSRLTLLSAPPGYGKTVAVAGWLGSRGLTDAWLSLDPADNDLARFVRYLVAALRAIRPALSDATNGLFGPGASPSVDLIGATLLDEVGRHRNLLLVRTVSKMGLAGLRLGLAIGPREWTEQLEKLRLPYNVGALPAAAAELLLGERAVLEAQTAAIVAERARLEAALDAIGGIRRYPSAANFVLVRVPDAPRAFEALRLRGILVRNFHRSHPLLEHCLRLTVGTPEENGKLLEALVPAIA